MTAVTVWFDASCPLCSREIALMRRLDRGGAIAFIDIDGGDPSCPIDRSALLERFHAREGDAVLSGAAAFAAMWRAIRCCARWASPLATTVCCGCWSGFTFDSSEDSSGVARFAGQPGSIMTGPPIPGMVLIYGVLGLIPFLAPPLIGLVLPGYRKSAASVLALYGALILSFLGGARWGLAIGRPEPDAGVVTSAMIPTLAELRASAGAGRCTSAGSGGCAGAALAVGYSQRRCARLVSAAAVVADGGGGAWPAGRRGDARVCRHRGGSASVAQQAGHIVQHQIHKVAGRTRAHRP